MIFWIGFLGVINLKIIAISFRKLNVGVITVTVFLKYELQLQGIMLM